MTSEYPKWVNPHESHLVRKGTHVTTPKFAVWNVNRLNGHVDVLVNDPYEEAFAKAPISAEELAAPVDPVAEAIKHDVRAEVEKADAAKESTLRLKKAAALAQIAKAEVERRLVAAKEAKEAEKAAADELAAKVAAASEDDE